MMKSHIPFAVGLLLATALAAGPAQAQILGGILNDSGGGLVDVQSGPAGGDSTVNVGLGGNGGGNLVDLKLGGSGNNLADVNVRNRGSLDVEANLFGGGSDLVTGSIASGLGLDVNLGLGLGLPGGPGGPGGPGQPGGPGAGAGGGAAAGRLADANCDLQQGRQILQIAAAGQYGGSAVSSWQRATNVRIVPMRVCAATRQQLSNILSQSSKVNQLHGYVAGDALISASLSRGKYGVGNVFAVERAGPELTVYVY
jgi:hypothetical protein